MVKEGFRGERLVVVPRPVVTAALRQPFTRRLLVTDIGYYPRALHHQMSRSRGIAETVVIVCASGTGWARIGDHSHRVGKQQALVLPPGVPHSYGADGASPWTIWWAHLSGTDVAELVQAMSISPSRPTAPIRQIERTITLLDETLANLERDQSRASLLASSGSAWKMLTQIAVDGLLPAPGDQVQRAMAYLAERPSATVSVPELAEMVGLSPSRLTALFRKATGGGVLAYRTALRMARARQLLDASDATITAIAREVGYDDAFYFSRLFHKHHGMSPTAYRGRDA